jgi:hypothetical protein
VPNFLNWSIDPDRQAGDTEVIETEYGYHVMYYTGDDELSYRDHMIIEEMREHDLEHWFAETVESVEIVKGNTSRMKLGLVLSN